jgi:hypothetical protein
VPEHNIFVEDVDTRVSPNGVQEPPGEHGVGSGAPEPAVGKHCIICSLATHRNAMFPVCDLCVAMDASLQNRCEANILGVRPRSHGSVRALKLHIDNLGVAGGQGCERPHVPGDGDCVFSSMALCKMVLERAQLPPVDRRSTWGQLCRKHFLQHVTKRLTDGDGFLRAASLQVLIQRALICIPTVFEADANSRQRRSADLGRIFRNCHNV